MEIASTRNQETDRQHPLVSPVASPGSNCVSDSCCSNGSSAKLAPTPPHTPTPKPIFRSDETNPYPTTFVQADTSSFKQVVQMLTGSSETAKQASSKSDPSPPASSARGGGSSGSIPPIRRTSQKKQGFKLYERRNSLKNGLMINTLISSISQNSGGFSPRNPEILSPSILDFPSLVLSPVTPLKEDTVGNSSEEEKAIAEKKFYLHPSPRTAPQDVEPKLLPLFPVISPRVSGLERN